VAQVQPKPGFPVTTSPGPKDRGSESKKDRQVQPKPGYPVTTSPPKEDAGSDSEYINRARGHVFDEKARKLPSKKVNDRVRKDAGSPPGY
jgi:hypothetical protein